MPKKLVELDEIEKCKTNCTEFSSNNFFSNQWLETNLFQQAVRKKVHPLFWVLLSKEDAKELSQNLSAMPSKCLNLIIKKLKDKSDRENFYATLSETQVLPYYFNKKSKNYLIEHEAPIVGSNKRPDLSITTKTDTYYGDIFTVFPDDLDRSLEYLQDLIREQIDEIQENTFIVSFGIELIFKEEDIDDFMNFIKTKMFSKPTINEDYNFFKDSKKLAYVSFYLSPKGKGFTGFMNSPARTGDNSGRIKNKILDKTNQLPDNSKNFVVINLSYLVGSKFDFENVFFGQLGVEINRQTHEAKAVRLPNSILNHPKGKKISAFIVYTKNYKNRSIYLNKSAEKVISQKELINI